MTCGDGADVSGLSFCLLCASDVLRASGPVDYMSLQNRTAVACKRTEEHIMKVWFPRVIHLLTSKKTLRSVREDKLCAFFDCGSTLISNQVGWSPPLRVVDLPTLTDVSPVSSILS